MALVPASSHGTSFDGGTITHKLTVDSGGPGGALLEVADAALPSFDIYAEETVLGGGAADASLNLIAAGSGRSYTDMTDQTGGAARLSTDQGLAVTGRTGLAAATPLAQVASASWGTVFSVRAESVHVFAPMRFRVSGPPILLNTTAPADGDLNAGECALWFDKTNGAGNTKLMVKGKSADGTVKTATILLA